MRLNWMKCQGDVWCKLNTVDLDHEHFHNRYGVYIIWHGGAKPAVVYIGQGKIKDRIAEHRSGLEIQQYANEDLYVTWATVPTQNRDGVEAYLAASWVPKVGERHPTAPQIEVNPPW